MALKKDQLNIDGCLETQNFEVLCIFNLLVYVMSTCKSSVSLSCLFPYIIFPSIINKNLSVPREELFKNRKFPKQGLNLCVRFSTNLH